VSFRRCATLIAASTANAVISWVATAVEVAGGVATVAVVFTS